MLLLLIWMILDLTFNRVFLTRASLQAHYVCAPSGQAPTCHVMSTRACLSVSNIQRGVSSTRLGVPHTYPGVSSTRLSVFNTRMGVSNACTGVSNTRLSVSNTPTRAYTTLASTQAHYICAPSGQAPTCNVMVEPFIPWPIGMRAAEAMGTDLSLLHTHTRSLYRSLFISPSHSHSLSLYLSFSLTLSLPLSSSLSSSLHHRYRSLSLSITLSFSRPLPLSLSLSTPSYTLSLGAIHPLAHRHARRRGYG